MFKTILLPIDQSREALEVASKAITLAKSHASRIIMLAIVQPEIAEMQNSGNLTSLLQNAQNKFEQAGIQCDVQERRGNPAFVICDVADELNIDLIIIGTKGVALESDSESTAARVIQLAPCPVLVVP